MAEESTRLRGMRDRLKDGLFAKLDELYINGSMTHRLPHNITSASHSSKANRCSWASTTSPSPAARRAPRPHWNQATCLSAGVGEDLAHTSIRFGLGRFNTQEEVDYVTNRVVEVVQRLRELSPLYEMAKEGIDLSKLNWESDRRALDRRAPGF